MMATSNATRSASTRTKSMVPSSDAWLDKGCPSCADLLRSYSQGNQVLDWTDGDGLGKKSGHEKRNCHYPSYRTVDMRLFNRSAFGPSAGWPRRSSSRRNDQR